VANAYREMLVEEIKRIKIIILGGYFSFFDNNYRYQRKLPRLKAQNIFKATVIFNFKICQPNAVRKRY
tara:strand:- start:70 stop:273 length:204 start_codon:yes stop_codon:yes gene_type:complete